MNLIQIQDDLKMLPDQALQQQLLRPSGMVPSYLVMSELARRREMRNGQAQRPQGSMAEEYAQGMGPASPAGPGQSLAQALAAPPPGSQPGVQPGPGLPPLGNPPQGMPGPGPGYADGGEVDMSYMPQYRRLMEMLRRQGMSMPPGGVPMPQQQGPAPLSLSDLPWMPSRERGRQVLPGIPSAPSSQPNWPTVPSEPSSRPDWGAIPDLEGSLGRYIRNQNSGMPPVGPSTDPSPRLMGPSEATPRPDLLRADPGLSLGQTMAMGLQGRRLEQNVPPPPVPPPLTTPGDWGAPGGQGYGGPEPMGETPRIDQGGGTDEPLNPGLPPPRPPGRNQAAGANPPGGGGVPPGGTASPSGGLPRPSGGAPGAGVPSQGGMLARQPLDDIMATLTGARGQDRYADLIAQNQQAKDDLLKVKEGDRAMALLTAGLGIMGGTSPDPWTNIGRGAMAGVADWNAASKEMRQAQRDLRNADQALTIAQANRDERAVEMAFKQKAQAEENVLRREDMALRRATSGASSAEAAANRALTLKLREQEVEQNKLDREERRNIQRETMYGNQYNQAGQELLGWQKQRGSSGYAMLTDEEKKEINEGIEGARNRMQKAQSDLYDYRVKQGIKSGQIMDALNMTPADVMAKVKSGEWPSGTRFQTPQGIRTVP